MSIEAGGSLRFGYVCDFDPEKKLARVHFPDKNGLTSGWLQVIVRNTHKNKDEINLAIGEHVACLMAGNGAEAGVILGAVWDEKNLPLVGDQGIRVTTYEDGTSISVDTSNHVVELKDSYGSFIRFEGGHIYVQSALNLYLNEGGG